MPTRRLNVSEDTFARWKLSLVSTKREKVPLEEEDAALSRGASPVGMVTAWGPETPPRDDDDVDMAAGQQQQQQQQQQEGEDRDPTTNHIGGAPLSLFDHQLLTRNHLPPKRPGASRGLVFNLTAPYLGIERPNPNPRRSRVPFQVFVRCQHGTLTIRCPDGDRTAVELLQHEIAERDRVPVSLQCLIYNGKRLDPKAAFADCGIAADANLQLIVRARGAPPLPRRARFRVLGAAAVLAFDEAAAVEAEAVAAVLTLVTVNRYLAQRALLWLCMQRDGKLLQAHLKACLDAGASLTALGVATGVADDSDNACARMVLISAIGVIRVSYGKLGHEFVDVGAFGDETVADLKCKIEALLGVSRPDQKLEFPSRCDPHDDTQLFLLGNNVILHRSTRLLHNRDPEATYEYMFGSGAFGGGVLGIPLQGKLLNGGLRVDLAENAERMVSGIDRSKTPLQMLYEWPREAAPITPFLAISIIWGQQGALDVNALEKHIIDAAPLQAFCRLGDEVLALRPTQHLVDVMALILMHPSAAAGKWGAGLERLFAKVVQRQMVAGDGALRRPASKRARGARQILEECALAGRLLQALCSASQGRPSRSCLARAILEELLRKGACVDFADGDGPTPLVLVAKNGVQLELVEPLLAAGADPDAPHCDGCSETTLDYLVRCAPRTGSRSVRRHRTDFQKYPVTALVLRRSGALSKEKHGAHFGGCWLPSALWRMRYYAGPDKSTTQDIRRPGNAFILTLHASRSIVLPRLRVQLGDDWRRRVHAQLDDEEGAVDAGGVLRELLSLAAAELLNMDTNLWRLVDGESLWPSCTSGATNDDHLAFFELTGKLVGLALLRGEVLPRVRFAAPLLRRLLRQPCPDPEDELRELDSELYRNKFAFVRTCSAEDLAALDLRFESTPALGTTGLQQPVRELKPGGRSITVTLDQREEFLRLLAAYELLCVKPQLDAFLEGANSIAADAVLRVAGQHLTAVQLGDLVGGRADIDVAEWRRHTQYRSGFSDASPQIVWFWELVGEMDLPRRRQLLRFATGSDVPPARGFKFLRGMQGGGGAGDGDGSLCLFTIKRLPDPASLADGLLGFMPRGHTCFNSLDLPAYRTRVALRAALEHFDFSRAMAIDDGAEGSGSESEGHNSV